MADPLITPGARPANVSRRQILSAAAAAPVLAVPREDWAQAFAAFRTAQAAAEAFYRAHLQGRKGFSPRIAALEKRLNDLEAVVDRRLSRLMRLRAPDMSALVLKFDLALDYRFVDDPDAHQVVRSWRRDLLRLAG